MPANNNSMESLKKSIILDLIELEKLDAVEADIINQVKNGKFDDDIEDLAEYATVTEATDSIRDSYRILTSK